MSPATRDTLFLHPGQLYAGRRLLVLKTILGSCVSVTLWHSTTRMAGMCHFVLANRSRLDEHQRLDCDGRYGVDAIAFLKAAAQATDANLANFRVGVFGGANISDVGPRPLRIGTSNVQLAERMLKEFGFRVQEMDVGGSGSRVLQLDTESGVTAMKYHSARGDDADRVVRGRGWA